MVKSSRERLESIKAAHRSSHGTSKSRREDYLEVISELVDLKGYATTLDISRYMDVSAPSVTKMLHKLDDEKYLKYERYHGINLTKKGIDLARGIRQKHSTLLEFFEMLGIDNDVANQDAEGIEHHLNPKTIKRLRKFLTFMRSDPKLLKRFNDL
ncbi:MAG: iron dependent repressor, DtxR family [Cenarchaeum symbiont of Oopsacas minuta]|nr:iron dependent repressor, DtxR family [Cenarchaeum symbiont of Oopsacas minuta]